MSVQGEAYISVRADLKPYSRDLDKGVRETMRAFEDSINKDFGRKLGRNISEGTKESLVHGASNIASAISDTIGRSTEEEVSKGVDRGIRRGGQRAGRKPSPFEEVAANLASVLDDGISALPVKAKAAIVAAGLAASPLLAGAISGAVSGGLAAGVAGIGVLLAFQFDSVQKRGVEFARNLRRQLAAAAEPFVSETLLGINNIESSFQSFDPQLRRIFAKAAQFVDPLTRATLKGFGLILDGIENLVVNGDEFIESLSDSIVILSKGIQQLLYWLTLTGEDGADAFRDFSVLLALSLSTMGSILYILTRVYAISKDLSTVFAAWSGPVERMAAVANLFGVDILPKTQAGVEGVSGSFDDLIVATDGETKALEEQEKAIQDAIRGYQDLTSAAYDFLDSQLAVADSAIDVKEALEDENFTFDLNTREGVKNARLFERHIRDISKALQDRVAQGEITNAEAKRQFDEQIEKLENQAVAAGGSRKAFQDLYDQIITTESHGFDFRESVKSLNDAKTAARGLAGALGAVAAAGARAAGAFLSTHVGGRGVTAYGDGGIVDRPTLALVGETGDQEVVRNTSQPQRSAQLLSQTPLAGLLGGSGTTVYVYVGNRQLEADMYAVAKKANDDTGRSLGTGPRPF